MSSEEKHRRSIRLAGYDYSQAGLYFVTICAKDRKCMFGRVEHRILSPVGAGLCSALENDVYQIQLSDIGQVIFDEWFNLEKRFLNIHLHDFVIMPNHFHGIIELCDMDRTEHSPAPTVGDIICAFKSITTRRCNKENNLPGRIIWQRNYHEHIIRNADCYHKILEYIIANPLKWGDDCYHPMNLKA